MRILVVEDTEDSRVLLEDVLKAYGYIIDSSTNGSEALQKVKQDRPDIIISDILMPEMDGFEFCRQLKRDPQYQSIPFIFYTATYTDARDEKLALSLGATRFIIKPQDPITLVNIIKEVWEEHLNGGQIQQVPAVSDEILEHMHAEVLNRKLNEKLMELERQGEELELTSLVYQNSSEGMVVTDSDNHIIAVNPAFSKITGYRLDEVKGKNPSAFSSGRHDKYFYQSLWQQLLTTGTWQGEVWDKRKNGEVFPKWLTINIIKNNDGSIQRYVAIFSDITQKKLIEDIIWRQANFDMLTGLPNRNMLRDRLETELNISKQKRLPLAFLLIDLDQFKEVNDTLGHEVGDILLQEAALRINDCVKEAIVARLGGDEFAVIISEISNTRSVENIAQKIISCLSAPYNIQNEVIYISGSIGVTMYPDDAGDIDTLLKNADQAMYAAKKKGRNCFCYFTKSLQDAAQTRLRLKNELRYALAHKQFKIEFQPIVDLETGSICKSEALLRWNYPGRGLVSPVEFIPLAEETGLINEIGDWVFKEAARWAKQWESSLNVDCQISINMSPNQFRVEEKTFAEEWLQYLSELGLSGKNINIEITEGLLLNAESNIKEKLFSLRDAGIQIAIDDFGTGYSSLSYIKKFDIDYLKIDRSFIHNLETDKNDIALSEAIIIMAHKLGLKVIAEGVETAGQEKILSEAGCDYAQGYLYSRPVTPEMFGTLLKNNR